MTAVEHGLLPCPFPRLGAKLLLSGPIEILCNIILLKPENCTYLGGFVSELDEQRRALVSILQKPAYGRRGPPLKHDGYMATVYQELQATAKREEPKHIGPSGGEECVVLPDIAQNEPEMVPETEEREVHATPEEQRQQWQIRGADFDSHYLSDSEIDLTSIIDHRTKRIRKEETFTANQPQGAEQRNVIDVVELIDDNAEVKQTQEMGDKRSQISQVLEGIRKRRASRTSTTPP